jgi:hypothetical protein
VEVAYQQYCQWEEQGSPKHWRDFEWRPQWPAGFTASAVSLPLWGDAQEFFFDHPEPFGFVVLDASTRGFLVFRGTESDADWYKDIEVAQAAYTLVTKPDFGRVHDGFGRTDAPWVMRPQRSPRRRRGSSSPGTASVPAW